MEFAEYRDYVEGDAPNLIDWQVFAKTDRYMIRRFQDETSLRACVLVDASASLHFRQTGPVTKFEYACSLAAGLMYMLVCQGDAAGLSFFTDRVTQRFAPVASTETLGPVLLEMEKVEAEGAGNIEKALHETAEMLTQRSLVIVISDLLQPPAQFARGIQHLQHNRHDVTVFHVLDAAEIGLPMHGLVELRDLETSEKLLIEADEIRPRSRPGGAGLSGRGEPPLHGLRRPLFHGRNADARARGSGEAGQSFLMEARHAVFSFLDAGQCNRAHKSVVLVSASGGSDNSLSGRAQRAGGRRKIIRSMMDWKKSRDHLLWPSATRTTHARVALPGHPTIC